MSIPTNLLAMPLISMIVETGTNEDWIDSILFLVNEVGLPQLDLTGIEFSMEVRRAAPDHEVVINGTTKDGTLAIGAWPDTGYLLINIIHDRMKIIQPGEYVADIVGSDSDSIRRCIVMTLSVVQGITRP
jgi:hypothetical protein